MAIKKSKLYPSPWPSDDEFSLNIPRHIDSSEALLACYTDKTLIDKYDAYQYRLNCWFGTMQDVVDKSQHSSAGRG